MYSEPFFPSPDLHTDLLKSAVNKPRDGAKLVKIVLAILMITGTAMSNADASQPLALFTFDSNGRGGWSTVHDTVMGGRSDGGLEVRDGVLHFHGHLSLENNGGFASIRRPVDLDLSDRSGIRLRVRGDGRSYQFRLHTDSRYFGQPVGFAGLFDTKVGEWIQVEVPFDQLEASFRGRKLKNYRFDPGKIELVGILLADKQPGPFKLEIDQIVAY